MTVTEMLQAMVKAALDNPNEVYEPDPKLKPHMRTRGFPDAVIGALRDHWPAIDWAVASTWQDAVGFTGVIGGKAVHFQVGMADVLLGPAACAQILAGKARAALISAGLDLRTGKPQ